MFSAISLLWHQCNYPHTKSSLTSDILQIPQCLQHHTFYSWQSWSFVYVQICQWLELHYYTLSEASKELYIICYIAMNYSLVSLMRLCMCWVVSQVGWWVDLSRGMLNGCLCCRLLTVVHCVVILWLLFSSSTCRQKTNTGMEVTYKPSRGLGSHLIGFRVSLSYLFIL